MTHSDNEKQKAARVLLADAIAKRDHYQSVIDFIVETYGAVATNGNGSAQGADSTAQTSADTSDDQREATYGAIRQVIYKLMLETNRKMTMSEVARRFAETGMQTEAATPIRSVRNAVRGLTRAGKVRKIGNGHYKALEPPAAAM